MRVIPLPSCLYIFCLVISMPFALPLSHAQSLRPPTKVTLDPTYRNTPITFEANRGQAPNEVKFLSRNAQSELLLTSDEAILILNGRRSTDERSEYVTLKWTGAERNSSVQAENEQSGRVNYLVGPPSQWLTDIPNYARVRYRRIYPGIDLVYHGNHRAIEYDLEVAPGADVSRIGLQASGTDLSLNSNGELVMHTSLGDLSWHKPIAFQDIKGRRREIKVDYKLAAKNRVTFTVNAYNHDYPLTIDPTLAFSALIGPANNYAYVAVDNSGSAYVATSTISREYPITGSAFMKNGTFTYQPPSSYTNSPHDLVAITKFSPDGSHLMYSTYLGGSQYACGNPGPLQPRGNLPWAITVDGNGDAVIVGTTQDTDFPVTSNALQPQATDCFYLDFQNGFVTKLNSTGSGLLYSTYLSGSGEVYASAVALDSGGNIYIGGATDATDFPHTKDFASCSGVCRDDFIMKLTASGTLAYSALFGGGPNVGLGPIFQALALDSDGDVYFTGSTQTQSLPVVKPIQRTLNGPQNAFVGELDSTASKFKFLTYYGGSGYDAAYGIGLDASGNIYFSGIAGSQDFPVRNAFQSTNPASACFLGTQSSFVTELTPSGTSVVYSTYFGGTTGCEATFSKMAVGADGTAYITGWTNSTDLPLTSDAFQTTPNPNAFTTAFLTVFQPGGQSLFYSTYLGGSGNNIGDQVTLSPDGNSAFVSGDYYTSSTTSPDFPVTRGAYDVPHGGNTANNQFGASISAAFLAKFCLTCGP
jgi:hypothetical protein